MDIILGSFALILAGLTETGGSFLMPDGSTNPKRSFGTAKLGQSPIPLPSVMLQAVAHRQGAQKCGCLNWHRDPVDALTYLDAIKRHLDLWAMGEDVAADGTHHLAHVMASAGILIDAWLLGTLVDNRDVLTTEQRERVLDYVEEQKRKVDDLLADRTQVADDLPVDRRRSRPEQDAIVNGENDAG